MEIRIAYHPASETLINRISELLKENGISAELNPATATSNSDVRIISVKEPETKTPQSLLDSSFVHIEQKPGY